MMLLYYAAAPSLSKASKPDCFGAKNNPIRDTDTDKDRHTQADLDSQTNTHGYKRTQRGVCRHR